MSEKGGEHAKQVSPWEWVAAAVSLMIVLATIGFLASEAYRGPGTPPEITLQVDSISLAGAGYRVNFSARNSGGSTAARLHVEAELIEAGNAVETSQTVIDYVPSQGIRQAGLFFSRDPRQGELRLRPLGYDQP